jgi:excisionase family DNA binding protein
MPEVYLTIEETAKRLKLTSGTVRRYAREGRLKTVRFGRRYCVPESALDSPVAAVSESTTPSNNPLAAALDLVQSRDSESSKAICMTDGAHDSDALDILSGLDSEDWTIRNAAIVALANADSKTREIVADEIQKSLRRNTATNF